MQGTVLFGIWVLWTAALMTWCLSAVPEPNLPLGPVGTAPAASGLALPAIGSTSILFAALNGLSPYLGLPKTYATWTMFSNLRVEAGRSNHWLVPASWQPFGFLRDVVVFPRVTGSHGEGSDFIF